MKTLTTAVVIGLSIAGCIADEEVRPGSEEDVDWQGDGKGDGGCAFDKLSAADYYKNFAYSDLGGRYRVGLTFFVQASLDSKTDVDLSVYFLAMNRVIVEYSELRQINSSESEVQKQTIVVTRATIDPATRALTIAGVGSGTPVTVSDSSGHCGPGINFKYTSDIRSAGLSGKSTEIVAGSTSARVIDPDHLEDLSPTMRKWFQEDVASGKIVVIRK